MILELEAMHLLEEDLVSQPLIWNIELLGFIFWPTAPHLFVVGEIGLYSSMIHFSTWRRFESDLDDGPTPVIKPMKMENKSPHDLSMSPSSRNIENSRCTSLKSLARKWCGIQSPIPVPIPSSIIFMALQTRSIGKYSELFSKGSWGGAPWDVMRNPPKNRRTMCSWRLRQWNPGKRGFKIWSWTWGDDDLVRSVFAGEDKKRQGGGALGLWSAF